MNFYIYSPVNFEKWDWRTATERGIGGSETSHVEMAWRLARRGHQVINYAPIPDDCPENWRGTTWYPLEKATFKEPGIWVIYRSPETLDKFKVKHPNQTILFVSQDEWYPNWQPKHTKIVDTFIPLCEDHKRSVLRHVPDLEKKIRISSNGIKMDLIRQVEAGEIPQRNPKKLIYASSPDRGLKHLLKIFKRAREFDPELELHVYYGFNNIDKLIKLNKRFTGYKKIKDEIIPLLDQPNVFDHGRINQPELYKEWLSAGIWCYPTNFTETSCITSMESQALGAIPITNPLWALAENVIHGVFIDGDANDPLIQARYAAEIVRVANDLSLQEQIREPMMKQARYIFNWERWVDQWESWVYGFTTGGMTIAQFNFQLRFAKGEILNVGCDVDSAKLKNLGHVTNLDIVEESPILKLKTAADIIADAREMPTTLFGLFDTVILGDILEHMNDKDIIKTLKNAKKCLRKDGSIVITCPDDHRPHNGQHPDDNNPGYAEGISSYHERSIPKEFLATLIEQAGLTVSYWQAIDYTAFQGNGFVCQ